ncbi:hypothetical protein D3C86_1331390 [compost metagenome]
MAGDRQRSPRLLRRSRRRVARPGRGAPGLQAPALGQPRGGAPPRDPGSHPADRAPRAIRPDGARRHAAPPRPPLRRGARLLPAGPGPRRDPRGSPGGPPRPHGRGRPPQGQRRLRAAPRHPRARGAPRRPRPQGAHALQRRHLSLVRRQPPRSRRDHAGRPRVPDRRQPPDRVLPRPGARPARHPPDRVPPRLAIAGLHRALHPPLRGLRLRPRAALHLQPLAARPDARRGEPTAAEQAFGHAPQGLQARPAGRPLQLPAPVRHPVVLHRPVPGRQAQLRDGPELRRLAEPRRGPPHRAVLAHAGPRGARRAPSGPRPLRGPSRRQEPAALLGERPAQLDPLQDLRGRPGRGPRAAPDDPVDRLRQPVPGHPLPGLGPAPPGRGGCRSGGAGPGSK